MQTGVVRMELVGVVDSIFGDAGNGTFKVVALLVLDFVHGPERQEYMSFSHMCETHVVYLPPLYAPHIGVVSGTFGSHLRGV